MVAIPDWLPNSAITDVAQLLKAVRPAIRLQVGKQNREVRRWARRLGLFASIDAEGYAALSRNPSLARRIMDLDRRPGRHTLALGTLLGYPVCCSRAAARVGDEGIDRRHEIISARRFHGRFSAIDPTGYAEGDALISHVPCSHRCIASLTLAKRTETC